YTSRQFVETAKLEALVHAMENAGVTLHYLEEEARQISLLNKLNAFLNGYFSKGKDQPKADAAAVVLFTSGSEGVPKGVVLSHTNIQANRFQLASRIDFGPTDIVFNALPIFHSFGLTGGTLLPLLTGIRTFFYPSPLHYRIVPELVYDTNATIMFGTDTFLAGYARFANPYDFYAVRYVFAGAEKLKEETRKLWAEKYGVRIFEGYGATETAPALSTNTPMHNKPGTVGRLLPAITYRLEDVPGIEEGGKLIVKGPNIMKGYLRNENPGQLKPPEDGEYDTGDIVSVDEEGYVMIKGRAKRFAKIAGEMVSLTAVETALSDLWPDYHHAVIAVPDAKKGEALVCVTENKKAKRADISAYAKEHGMSELSVPRTIEAVDAIPLLGTGKTDYVSLQKQMEAKAADAA
ncbi:MAG: AMP-binding protein, partial [Rickettsiales bacterium]